MKKCKSCWQPFEDKEFIYANKKTGFCKECNRKFKREAEREYYAKNKERISNYRKRKRKENPNAVRKYYEKNKETLIKKSVEYNREHADERSIAVKKSYLKSKYGTLEAGLIKKLIDLVNEKVIYRNTALKLLGTIDQEETINKIISMKRRAWQNVRY